MGRERRNPSPWVLTGNDKSHQGWLTEEHIYTWPVKPRIFWEHKQLKEQERNHLTDPRATADLWGQCSWSLPSVRWLFSHRLVADSSSSVLPWRPGPGKKMKHKGEEKQQAIWPWMHVNTCSWNQSFKWKKQGRSPSFKLCSSWIAT